MGNDLPQHRQSQLATLILTLAVGTIVLGVSLVAVVVNSGPPGDGGAATSPGPSQSASASASASPSASASVSPVATPTAAPDKPNAAADDACAIARVQLRRGDAEQARETLEAADVTEATYKQLDAGCESTWILASTLEPDEPEEEDSFPAKFGEAWDGFVKGYAKPLAGAAGFVLGGWLALFVLARLLVELPRMRDLTSDAGSRRGAAVLGWLLIALTPVAAVLIGSWMQDGSMMVGVFPWFWVGALALIGAIALGAWLATIRSLVVVVKLADGDGATSDAKAIDSSAIVAQLRSLAGGRTKSVELPAGPAVSEVASSLTDISSAAWVAAVQKIVLFLVGVAPWTATVVVSSDTEATVTVSRNRATKNVAYIFVQGIGWDALAEPPAAVKKRQFLIVFIAAEILVQLREGYPEEFDPDLYGATSSASIALQLIATTWYATGVDTTKAQALLAAALRLDPYNELARYSLEYVTHRGATEIPQLVAFGNQLDEWIEAHPRDDELLQGMILTRAAAARNLGATALKAWRAEPPMTLDDGTPRAQAVAAIQTSRSQFVRITLNESSTDRKERIAAARLIVTEQALIAAEALLTAPQPPVDPAPNPPVAGGIPTDAGAMVAVGATPGPVPEVQAVHRAEASLAYSFAAMLVCWNRTPFVDDRVMSLLKIALLVPVYREFAEKDPELAVGVGFAVWLDTLEPIPAEPPPLNVGPNPPAGAGGT